MYRRRRDPIDTLIYVRLKHNRRCLPLDGVPQVGQGGLARGCSAHPVEAAAGPPLQGVAASDASETIAS